MKSGYFLLEALIAIVVLGIALSSILNSLSAANKNMQVARMQARVLVVSEEVLENVRRAWTVAPWPTPPFAALTVSPFRAGPFALGYVDTRDGAFDSFVGSAPYRASYTITRADVDARGATLGLSASSLFFVDLVVADKNNLGLGASFTIVLAKRTP